MRDGYEILRTPIAATNVGWSDAGPRLLHDDAKANPSAISRDYVPSLDNEKGRAPVLSMFGGKITTHSALTPEGIAGLADYGEGRALAEAWPFEHIQQT
jgi:glycerol-3-phosphate dehydrogenase